MVSKPKRTGNVAKAETEFSSPACLAHEVDQDYMFARPQVRVKGLHEAATPEDGLRVLAERAWPNDLKPTGAAIDLWLKEAAPSPELCEWFGHDLAKWEEFCRRYWAELDRDPAVLSPVREAAGNRPVTLLHTGDDLGRNAAVALKTYLDRSV